MSGCDFDALESLAFGELAPAPAEAARAHVAACAACARELALLQRERGAFAARAQATTSPLPGFSAALARSRWSGPPAVVAKAPPQAVKPRFPWAIPAFGVAAAAAFAGLFLLPPAVTTQLVPAAEAPIAAEPATEDFCRDEAFYNSITSPAKSPTVCEMPEPVAARPACAAEPSECGSCAVEANPSAGNDTCEHDSRVTEACYQTLPR